MSPVIFFDEVDRYKVITDSRGLTTKSNQQQRRQQQEQPDLSRKCSAWKDF